MSDSARVVRSVEYYKVDEYLKPFGVEEVGHCDPEKVVFPEGIDAFRFFEVCHGICMVDGKEYKVRSPERLYDSTVYIRGKYYTLEQIKEVFPELRALAIDIPGNKCSGAIRTASGKWHIALANFQVL